jgi:predicted RNA-binding protein YlxR (DUF448 family)
VRPKRDLVRIVRGPDGVVAIDATGQAAGRGAYLCRDASCWDAAARKRALEHALGTAIPADVLAVISAGPDAMNTTTTTAGASSPAPTIDTDHQGGTRGEE